VCVFMCVFADKSTDYIISKWMFSRYTTYVTYVTYTTRSN